MRRSTPENDRRRHPPENLRRTSLPPNSRVYPNQRPIHPSNHHYNRQYSECSSKPSESASLSRPNFIIELVTEKRSVESKTAVQALIDKCKPQPLSSRFNQFGVLVAALYFREWVEALEAMVWFWETRLDGVHTLTPNLNPLVIVTSDVVELRERLQALFADRIRRLIEGEEVKKWNSKRDDFFGEIRNVMALLRKPRTVKSFNELQDRLKGIECEKDLVEKKVAEFKCALNSLLDYVEGKRLEQYGEENVQVFKLEGDFNWRKIHSLMLRECRRLNDGLPIYAYRREILQQIHNQQIMVLVGETGSGKSTQLVQYLADSGIAASKSIVCTQPRKIAAVSLEHRVREECCGCYGDGSITCYPTFLSDLQFDSKVIYMTDNCLLQYYMTDKNMSKISCIIVDEVHERSLNTDMLLVLVKSLLCQRLDLRLIIMSATADGYQLSDYFNGCGIMHVVGRNFPVDIKYVPFDSKGTSGVVASYVSDVVRMAKEVHKNEKKGSILAFLTSQMEVEWACEDFEAPAAVALPLHGKLSFDEQFRVFQNDPKKRKVIFATNLAETSLTIPGVKYVIDSGMVKESVYEPCSGMNVLKVCTVSKSSARQRAGRAGRTEPGRCYRLYSESDFEMMPPSQEPEIRRVHLGVAVLRILALGIKKVQDFDFIDAPSPEAIDMAIRNLVQLGAVIMKNDVIELTQEGRYLVKIGVEPRLGKLILSCFDYRLGREGLVLAALTANASNIFCRVGTSEEKLKSDCLKVQFCHQNGDLFTLLSVYREWDALPQDKKNKWCWENSVNAKSMRRCRDTVMELESCIRHELNMIIPSFWCWNPKKLTHYDGYLKKVILSALSDNVAMFSGCDLLGYEVAMTGQHFHLHPSCSLLIYNQKPSWVVFANLLSVSKQYLVCVTAFDFDSLSTLYPPPLFDVSKMESQKLQVRVLNGFGNSILRKFCGKGNSNMICHVSRLRADCMDERISIKVNFDQNEVLLFAPLQSMERVSNVVSDALDCERRWMQNECVEKCLYNGVAFFGCGAEIKRLELLQKSCSTVDVYVSNVNAMSSIDEKELLIFLEKFCAGSICSVKFTGSPQNGDGREKWSTITFLSPDAAQKASELKQTEFNGLLLKVIPSVTDLGDHNFLSFPAVKAKVSWPRRISKGFGIVKCDPDSIDFMINDFCNLTIGGKSIRCEHSVKHHDSLVIGGLDKELSEAEILDVLRNATNRRILDFFLIRGESVENPAFSVCKRSLEKEISSVMPKRNLLRTFHVQVFDPKPTDSFTSALISFDGRLHLEAARALEQLEGKILPGCRSWQKIKCPQLFHSSLSCAERVYFAIENELLSLLASFKHQKGVECSLKRNDNGSYHVKISTNATRTVAEIRRHVDKLMKGKTVDHVSLTPAVLQLLSTREGIKLIHSLQQQTGTHIFFDRYSLKVRVFGSSDKIAAAEEKLIHTLLNLHESKQLKICLGDETLPYDLMKKMVSRFGWDLHGLKEKIPKAEFSLDTHRHVISIDGDKESKRKVEEIIFEIVHFGDDSAQRLKFDNCVTCPICLCDVENGFQLEDCTHMFCQTCLIEQCESAIKSQDCFPLRCAQEGCGSCILLKDLRILLSNDKLEELFRASLLAFVASSGGRYRFCPSPDCPSVYQVAAPGTAGEPFVCGACYEQTCTRCHLEYHPYMSCEKYRELKDDPDTSLNEWRKGKDVKNCPLCGHVIEKVDGCNHIECRCGKHICWVCLEHFQSSDNCYGHLREVHGAIM